MKNKIALVTGGSRGIGASIGRMLAKQNADIVLVYRTAEAKVKSVVDEIQALGQKAIAIQADVGKPKQIQDMLKEAEQELGSIDILVNNAGIYIGHPTSEFTHEELERLVAVNLLGMYHCIQGVLPEMINRRWGRIINLSSICAFSGCSDSTAYSMTKGGVNALTRSLAKEVAPHNITVNTIAPGAIASDMLLSLPSDELNKIKAEIPIGRIGEPEDIGAAVVFLSSQEAKHITGTTLHVNGGVFL